VPGPGAEEDLPIITSAVTTPLVRKISTDAIVRAYERAGLCTTDPKKPQDHLGFGSTMSRDALDKASQVVGYRRHRAEEVLAVTSPCHIRAPRGEFVTGACDDRWFLRNPQQRCGFGPRRITPDSGVISERAVRFYR
jgi:hypothetical protein